MVEINTFESFLFYIIINFIAKHWINIMPNLFLLMDNRRLLNANSIMKLII